ncbi:MAG: GatB/YqeY domain-containing protein [Myxococcota bacterium]
MAILDRVSEALKDAMRNKDKTRIDGLRAIRAAFIEALKVDGSTELADDKSLEILRRLAKQRKESIEAFTGGGRDDLVAEEKGALAVIESFLPQTADAATTRGWVQEAIAASGATSARDMGKVMSALLAAHRAELDAKLANQIVRELLPG